MSYADLKDFLCSTSGFSKDALHVHISIMLYILFALLFQRKWDSAVPWAAVLLLELANEGYDLSHANHAGTFSAIVGSVKDLLNTMAWPTAMLIVGRNTSVLVPVSN